MQLAAIEFTRRVILDAKLGATRKDAQIDSCEAFAAALGDVLKQHSIQHRHNTASFFVGWPQPEWYHAVVEVGGVFFDSLGDFSHEIVRQRAKIHKTVKTDLKIHADLIEVEEDSKRLYLFYLKKLQKTAYKLSFLLEEILPHKKHMPISQPRL